MYVLQLGPGLHGLGHVQVHLVTVKIRIVRRGVTEQIKESKHTCR